MKKCPSGAIVRKDEVRRVMSALQIHTACCISEMVHPSSRKLWKKRLRETMSLYKQFRRTLA